MTEKTVSLSTYYYKKAEVDNNFIKKSVTISASENDDPKKSLNDYTETGLYYCSQADSSYLDSDSLPITNKPFILQVYKGSSARVKQVFTTTSTNVTYIRTMENSVWNSWVQQSDSTHIHGNITADGKIGSTANKPIITTASGVLTTGSFGTTANTFCQGNDGRLSNAREPTSHQHGDITNDGKIGSVANKPIITTTSGKLTAGSFETTASNIQMNGTANVGSLNTFARADHIHPSDSSKADINHSHMSLTETSVIPASSNLNNELYTIEGYYKIKNEDSKTLENRPYPDETYNKAARLEVKYYKNGNFYEYLQFYYVYTGDIYYRRGHQVTLATDDPSYVPLTWENWKKITNFESLSTVATSGSYNDLLNKPDLKTVATSGSYNDLNNLPTIPEAYVHPNGVAKTGQPNENKIPAFGSTFTVTQFTSNSLGHITGATDRTIQIPNTLANGSTAGLSQANYTSEEKAKLNGIAINANNYQHPNSHPATMISGLADVATTGSYEDLDPNTVPTIPTDVSELTDTNQRFALREHSHYYSDLNGKPSWTEIPIGQIFDIQYTSNPIPSSTHLWYNELLGICYLRFGKEFGSIQANYNYEWNASNPDGIHLRIASRYRLGYDVFGSSTHGGQIWIRSNGYLGGRFTQSYSGDGTTVYGSIMWVLP